MARKKALTILESGDKIAIPEGQKVDRFAPDPKEIIECTPDVGAYIIRGISKGRSLISICNEDGLPHHTTFLKQCQNNPELAEAYSSAKRLRAHIRVEDVEGIVENLDVYSTSKQEAYVADIKAKNLVRLAEIGDPNSFSPKMQMMHQHSGNVVTITMDLTSPQAKPIDIESSPVRQVTETKQEPFHNKDYANGIEQPTQVAQPIDTPALASPQQGDKEKTPIIEAIAPRESKDKA